MIGMRMVVKHLWRCDRIFFNDAMEFCIEDVPAESRRGE